MLDRAKLRISSGLMMVMMVIMVFARGINWVSMVDASESSRAGPNRARARESRE